MDRLSQLRSEAGGSGDSSPDVSAPSEAYMTANESSKYFTLSEEDQSFDITSIKDVSLVSATDPETITGTDQLISNLSPIPKKNDLLDSYKFGKQIEAANILSGGVDIFDDNDNSYDGDELVIDDNVVDLDDKSNPELKMVDNNGLPFQKIEEIPEASLVESESPIASKDTEVVLQIDGKNVNAIDIGNGLYLYRKEGEEELAAVQIIDDEHQPNYKFLKVRENSEGNLEVYEEIEIEVPKEVPTKEIKNLEKNASHVPIKGINKVISDPTINKVAERKPAQKEQIATTSIEPFTESKKDTLTEISNDVNLNTKMMKINETRKSPVIHSTPNKEGIPLTKTMVDLQLHPNRHSDNVKTIEVHTDSNKQRLFDTPKKDSSNDNKTQETLLSKEVDECRTNVEKESELPSDKTKSHETKPVEDAKIEGKQFDTTDKKSSVDTTQPKDVIVKPDTKLTNKELNDCTVLTQHTSTHKESTTLESTKEQHDGSLIEVSGINLSDKDSLDTNLNDCDDEKKPSNVTEEANEELIHKDKTTQGDTSKNDVKNDEGNEKQNIHDGTKNPTVEKRDILAKKVKQMQESENVSENKKYISEQSTLNTSGSTVSNIISVVETVKTDLKECVVSNLYENPSCTIDTMKAKEKLNVTKLINKHNEPLTMASSTDKTASKIECTKKQDSQNTFNEITNTKTEHKDTITNTKTEHKDTITKEKVYPTNEKKTIKAQTQEKDNKYELKNKNKIELPDKDTKPNNIKSNLLVKEVEKKQSSANTDNTDSKNKQPIVDVSTVKALHLYPRKQTDKKYVSSGKTEIHNMTITINKESVADNTSNDKKIANIVQKSTQCKTEIKKEITKIATNVEQKHSNDNHDAVPFGKWTEVNRQDFLNKIKESKVPTNNLQKQIKQPNDLNRRDFFQKVEGPRQIKNVTTKLQELRDTAKPNVKNETKTFASKPTASKDSKLTIKTELPKTALIAGKTTTKEEHTLKSQADKSNESEKSPSMANITKKESTERKEINNQDIIDITVEGIINRVVAAKPQEETKQSIANDLSKNTKSSSIRHSVAFFPNADNQSTSLDAIEMKMNELHGIPFVERPPHQLPKLYNLDIKTHSKSDSQRVTDKPNKMPHLLPVKNKGLKKIGNDNILEIDSEEEIIEHEPVTGDIEYNKKKVTTEVATKVSSEIITTEDSKKKGIITENDFEKFVRRNSIAYENCLTVNFENKEQHNVVQTIVEKDAPKKFSRNEILLAEAKVKSSLKQQHQHRNIQLNKTQVTSKSGSENVLNKNYQSKLNVAYKSALTAKRQMDPPITIIEDKPVKVVFMDNNSEFCPNLVNVPGQDLTPTKKKTVEVDAVTISTTDSLDSDVLDSIDDKLQDESKTKTKHQRKQVLTPVDAPELELIEPVDLGIQISPKKKRRTEEGKPEKSVKSLVPKKCYLLGRGNMETTMPYPQESNKNSTKDIVVQPVAVINHSDTASAIDNLVKAAELLETQPEFVNINTNVAIPEINQQNTPVKRGRGRPRKYPITQVIAVTNKSPSPPKKPRLTDAKPNKRISSTDGETSDDEIIKENWTMGKINENIVCPICSKLFRSENVVFKHVKHCTGPSPNRSESDKSFRQSRFSQESEIKSQGSQSDDMDDDIDEIIEKKTYKKRQSRDVRSESDIEKSEVVVIEESPKEKLDKSSEPKQHKSRNTVNKMTQVARTNLACEFCGKTFRQLSYLVSHKLQHKKDANGKTKKVDIPKADSDVKTVLKCEICKKDFRKLHHLVQHRIIHNQSNVSLKATRKSSSELSDFKNSKEYNTKPANEDQTAAFRCDPCDKSFRKLHHLVEHRETHDGINRQKSSAITQSAVDKPLVTTPPQCSICKKTFRKLHHLIEHKEQHLETSSEKSDDKSVKSALSTKDIIHECSLCYMVFPNEHSLNKHSVICQRKKRQSTGKQVKPTEGEVPTEAAELSPLQEPSSCDDKEMTITTEEKNYIEESDKVIVKPHVGVNKLDEDPTIKDNRILTDLELKIGEPNKKVMQELNISDNKDKPVELPNKSTKNEEKSKEDVKVKEPSKVKIPDEDKDDISFVKRQKTDILHPVEKDVASSVESSDDDEVRYMLNPNYKIGDSIEGKLFMKVKAKKRNSLQIERPNCKDLVKRRISLQHPPKIPRLKPKPNAVEPKHLSTNVVSSKPTIKPKLESVPSTDSDDSDVKYSFPKSIPEKPSKSLQEPKTKEGEKSKQNRITIAQKKKTLTGIAKKKSIGKGSPAYKEKSSSVKPVKRRTMEVEHKCDCGQLYSSAALLSRHITVAHTPPRMRRRRSPPPDESITKPIARKTNVSEKLKTTDARKSSIRSDLSTNQKPSVTATTTRKSTATDSKSKVSPKSKTESTKNTVKAIRSRMSVAHRGVPVPEKMKKILDKLKK